MPKKLEPLFEVVKTDVVPTVAPVSPTVTKSDEAAKIFESLYSEMSNINIRSRGVRPEVYARWLREFQTALELLKRQ